MEAYLKLIAGKRIPVVKVDNTAFIVADGERNRPQLGDKPGKNHKLFMEQLAKLTSGKSSPAAGIFKANKRLRAEQNNARGDLAQMEQFMPGITQVFLLTDHAVRSDLLTLSLTVGEKPSAQLVATTKNEDDAKAMVAQLGKAVTGFKKMEATMKQDGRNRGGPDMLSFIGMGQMLSLTPLVDGKTVTLKTETKTFESIGKQVVQIMKMQQERAKRYALQNQMRQLLIGVQSYAADHNGQAPDKLDDIEKYVGGGKAALAKLLKHPITGEAVGVKYYKPPQKLSEIQRPHITALIFEVQKGKVVANGVTGYADGHVRGQGNKFDHGPLEAVDPEDEVPPAERDG